MVLGHKAKKWLEIHFRDHRPLRNNEKFFVT